MSNQCLMKSMEAMEEYMQLSFQMNLDESESPDHSFKFAKMIKSVIRTGRIWNGTYDSISLSGLVTMNFFCHSKENSEITPAISDNRLLREKTNAPPLKRVEGDGGGDSSAWMKVFNLPSTPKPKLATYKGLPTAHMKKDYIQHLHSPSQVHNWVAAISEKLPQGTRICYGLDTEQNFETQQTKVIQICLPSNIAQQVAVIDLEQIGALCKDDFSTVLGPLKRLLENEMMVPVAVQVYHDTKVLSHLGVNITGTAVDIIELAKKYERNGKFHYGLQDLTSRHLGLYVDKEFQKDAWQSPLSERHIQYAALDAYVHLLLFKSIKNKIAKDQKSGKTELEYEDRKHTSEIHSKVLLTTNWKTVATGTLTFVGGKEGECKNHGGLHVGVGKSLIRLESVTCESAKTCYGYTPEPGNQVQWNYSRQDSLQGIFDRFHSESQPLIVCWPSNRVSVDLWSHGQDRIPDHEESASENGSERSDSQESDGMGIKELLK